MTATPRLVAFAGSYRKASYNGKVLAVAVAAARAAGAEVEVINLKDLALPIYDEDLEAESGMPAGALRLKEALQSAQGMLIASPEYNSSISPALKNAIDWATRPAPGDLAAFSGKLAVLMATSPGALGGLRGLVTVRSILGNIGVLVLPEQVAVPRAFDAFLEDGQLKDQKLQLAVQALGTRITKLAARFDA